MLGICPNCEKETSLVFVKEPEEMKIRGEIITVDNEYFVCEECGEEFEDPKSDYDPLESAYTKYRDLKGMVTPEEIKDFRKKYGLTQLEFSKLIGIGIATLNRYENNALQSEAHDHLLRLYMDERNFRKLLVEDEEVLDDAHKQEIFKSLETKVNQPYLDELSGYLLRCRQPSINTGFKKFDFEKFLNSVKFFCYQDRNFKTKLTKLLFYADFKHYKHYAISITGSCYAQVPHGPVPDNFETLLGLAVDKDESLRIEEVWGLDYSGEVYISDSPPDYIFTNSEFKILTTIKEKFSNYNARQIRDFSHNETGYKATENGELIPYRYAEELQEI